MHDLKVMAREMLLYIQTGMKRDAVVPLGASVNDEYFHSPSLSCFLSFFCIFCCSQNYPHRQLRPGIKARYK